MEESGASGLEKVGLGVQGEGLAASLIRRHCLEMTDRLSVALGGTYRP